MTPEEALNILYTATRKISTVADDHEVFRTATQLLLNEIRLPKAKIKKPKPVPEPQKEPKV